MAHYCSLSHFTIFMAVLYIFLSARRVTGAHYALYTRDSAPVNTTGSSPFKWPTWLIGALETNFVSLVPTLVPYVVLIGLSACVEIDPTNVTHIIYSFANVKSENGTLVLGDIWMDAQLKNRNLKVLLSVGGENSDFGFMSSSASREEFVRSAVQLIKDYGLDDLLTTTREIGHAMQIVKRTCAMLLAVSAMLVRTIELNHLSQEGQLPIGLGEGSIQYNKLPSKWNFVVFNFITDTLSKEDGADVVQDNSTVSSYSYDECTQELVSYDTPNTFALKANYIMKYPDGPLAGAMHFQSFPGPNAESYQLSWGNIKNNRLKEIDVPALKSN
ncbi:glycoside hydrolase superfamily [Mycena latifolia]|nr:glycoside hydrolase superfamily [Mycena latifolia]